MKFEAKCQLMVGRRNIMMMKGYEEEYGHLNDSEILLNRFLLSVCDEVKNDIGETVLVKPFEYVPEQNMAVHPYVSDMDGNNYRTDVARIGHFVCGSSFSVKVEDYPVGFYNGMSYSDFHTIRQQSDMLCLTAKVCNDDELAFDADCDIIEQAFRKTRERIPFFNSDLICTVWKNGMTDKDASDKLYDRLTAEGEKNTKRGMDLIDSFTSREPSGEEKDIHTVALDNDHYVDVAVKNTTGLVYVMESGDGSKAYDPVTGKGYADYTVDERAVVGFCHQCGLVSDKAFKQFLDGMEKSVSDKAGQKTKRESVHTDMLDTMITAIRPLNDALKSVHRMASSPFLNSPDDVYSHTFSLPYRGKGNRTKYLNFTVYNDGTAEGFQKSLADQIVKPLNVANFGDGYISQYGFADNNELYNAWKAVKDVNHDMLKYLGKEKVSLKRQVKKNGKENNGLELSDR